MRANVKCNQTNVQIQVSKLNKIIPVQLNPLSPSLYPAVQEHV